jgi:TRAP transporter TAXI family solute receptor
MLRLISKLLASCAAALAVAGPGAVSAGTPYKIVTASERGTYIQIGRDLAKFVAPSADIDLEVLPSAGSSENIQRLRSEPGVKFALVQSDVYQAFIAQGVAGNRSAADMIRPLRAIMPLYNEEIYFIARADSPLNFVHEIRNARLNVGPLRSGTAMSATTLYRLMFGQPVADERIQFLNNEDALIKLTSDNTLDVVVVVAGQPAKLLVDMKPEARALIKLLKFDREHPASQAALKTYFPSTVLASNYPNLLAEDVPGLAVKAFLVTYDYDRKPTQGALAKFARSLCTNFDTLRTQGHPKWKEVTLAMPELGRGWAYYPPMARELGKCMAAQAQAKIQPPPAKPCATEQRILGLCG